MQETGGIAMISKVIKNPTVVAQLTGRLSGIRGPRACNYLSYTFNAGTHPIIINGVSTTINKLFEDFKGMEHIEAKDIGPIRFYGGPPCHRKWYSGTLLSILLDFVLGSYANGDNDSIHRFLETAGIWQN